jgi:hypothetical protein
MCLEKPLENINTTNAIILEVGHRTLCYVKSTIHRYLTVSRVRSIGSLPFTLFSNQCNVSCFMFSQDVRVPRAQAHAIKYKATYCLLTSWGSTTTAARSPTTTYTYTMATRILQTSPTTQGMF